MSTTLAHQSSRLTHVTQSGKLPFYVGAALDLLVGVGMVLFSAAISGLVLPGKPEILGLSSAAVVSGLGIFLIVFGIDTALAANSRGWLRKLLPAVVVINWIWVAASALIAVAFSQHLSALGIALIAGSAACIAWLTNEQRKAL